MDKRGDGGASLHTSKALAQATTAYQKGEFAKAATAYTACLHELSAKKCNDDHRIGIIYNRATCHLKLKNYVNLLADCEAVFALDPTNTRLYGRKVKALCSLGRFTEAHAVARRWTQVAPENPQAKKEHGRLDRIVTALQEQEDDGLEDSLDEPGVAPGPSDGAPAADGQASWAGGGDGAEAAAELNGVNPEHHHAGYDAGGATGVTERSVSAYTCTCCDIAFNTRHELCLHLNSHLHHKKVSSDEESEWRHRPPPRGLTSREYSKCPRYFGEGTCRFGIQCSQAHSEGELAEWKERFDQKNERLQQQKDMGEKNNRWADQLLKLWLNADNQESVMTKTLEGVMVHVGSDLAVTMLTKRCTHNWTFTVTSKMCLRRVALLDDATRRHFHFAAVTIGPKKSQKSQIILDNCQEWINPAFSSNRQSIDKVYRIKVSFKTDIFGALRQTVVFDFGSEPVLVRHLLVDSKPISDLDTKSLDLKLDETARWDLSTKTIIDFIPSPHTKEREEEALLSRYPPPMEGRFTVSEALLEPTLQPQSYRMRMHDLLYIEEMAQFSAISKFNVKTTVQIVDRFMLMPSTVTVAKFAQGGELFAQMRLMSDISEDTAQGRLILQNVSHVYVASYNPKQEEREGPQSQEPSKVYEALVEEKGKNFIFIRLSKQCVTELKLSSDQEVSAQVQFQLNRLPLCQMHDAVDRLADDHFVFPNIAQLEHIPWNPQRQWSDKLDMRLNAKQKEAIVAITTELSQRLPPILIVGPYGTGKTFTLAQATKQILKQQGTRVLICTHSNSAADLYIKDYLHPYVEDGHPEARPLRIYYRQRWTITVNPIVFEYCLVINRGTPAVQFFRPTREDVEAHRVIVCTLSTARYLYDLQLQQDCFSHILLDESAQAMECETIMPLAVAGPMTRVVLAGDHMQLSPEVHSDFARDRQLHVSLLERMYDFYPPSNPCKILLCENYRSHKAVLDYTSELFYDNKLVASGSQPRHELFFPLTFFTARGEDLQHQNSTTFYNNSEVYEVVERVSELSKMWPTCWGSIDDNGIGIVSPYSDQVIRIRAELRKRKLYNVSVERVLNVQGKQFRAIFLSTVRTRHTCSTDDSLQDDMDYGFLSNVKLLNTAITRAQSLVAVVGDPISLCTIGKCRKLWERFLEICNKNNSLHGITWNVLRSQLDGVELKKTYILNPLAPEFIPNRLRHACYSPPEPVGFGKYGFTFTPSVPRQTWGPRPPPGVFMAPPPQPMTPSQKHVGVFYTPAQMMPMPMVPSYPGPPMPRPWLQTRSAPLNASAAASFTGSPITLPGTTAGSVPKVTSHSTSSTTSATFATSPSAMNTATLATVGGNVATSSITSVAKLQQMKPQLPLDGPMVAGPRLSPLPSPTLPTAEAAAVPTSIHTATAPMSNQPSNVMLQQGPPGLVQKGPPALVQQGPPALVQQGPPALVQQGLPTLVQQGPPAMVQQGPSALVQQGPPGLAQQSPPGLPPRMGYQHGIARFSFVPQAHMVPQMYHHPPMPPHYIMPVTHGPRPHQPAGPTALNAHSLLGAPITPHKMGPVGILPYAAGPTVGPTPTSSNAVPSPISPLANWPGLPAPGRAPELSRTPERLSSNPTTTTKSPLPTGANTDSNHNSVQLLPNVCNATTDMKSVLQETDRRSLLAAGITIGGATTTATLTGTHSPITTSVGNSTTGTENGFKNPFNINPQLLLHNAYLQRELCSYIQQTQGVIAAQNFMKTLSIELLQQQQQQQQQQLQQQSQPGTLGKHSVSPNHPANHNGQHSMLSGMRNRNAYTELLQKGRVNVPRHETVSVNLEDTPATSSDRQQDTAQLASMGSGTPVSSADLAGGACGPRFKQGGLHEMAAPKAQGFPQAAGYGPLRGEEHWEGGHMTGLEALAPYKGSSELREPGRSTTSPQTSWDQLQNGSSHPLHLNSPTYRKRYNSAGPSRIPPPNLGRQRSASGEAHPQLSDCELPQAVDHMVKYIEDSIEDKYQESELGNIHIGHNALKLSLSAPGGSSRSAASAEMHAPLYLRRGSNSTAAPMNMSYAGALRSQPPAAPCGDKDPAVENPLDLLRNLNIKASPGTQAFYQYFS